MRYILAAALTIASIGGAAAQQKISPRIRKSGARAFVVVFRDAAAAATGRTFLTREGFDLLEHPDLGSTDVLIGGPDGKLDTVAGWNSVAYVLPASQDLLVGRRVHRCSGPIEAPGELVAAYSTGGRGWPAEGGAVELKLAFEALPASVDQNAAKGEIERAFGEWERYGKFSISSDGVAGAPRTIGVRFARGAHNDSYPFDGRGGMLAHTFYPAPPNSEPVAGDMHFDADEPWGIGAGVDLFTVALHEAGHALGLGHSDQPGAVMYPYYRQAYGLTSDDIEGIQALYGTRGAATTSPQPPAAPPTTTPSSSNPAAPPSNPAPPSSGIDRSAPAVRIALPSAASITTSAAAVALAGTASDDVGVVAVRWSTSTGGAGDTTGTSAWTASVPVYPGVTVITVRAYDAAGNSGWRSITVTRR